MDRVGDVFGTTEDFEIHAITDGRRLLEPHLMG